MEAALGAVDTSSNAPPRRYARFSRRFQALVIDSLVYAASLIALILLLEFVGFGGSGRIVVLAWLAFLILYEPLLVWRRGATVGHAYANIGVIDLRPGGNPGFLRAMGRFWLKGLLGLLAFAFMATTRRRQALHDLAFGTTVEIRDSSRASAADYLEERVPDTTRVHAAAWRRVLVIVLYSLIWFVCFSFVLAATESADCVGRYHCGPGERLWETLVGLAWMGGQAACLIYGWSGRLLGARSRPAPGSIGPDTSAA